MFEITIPVLDEEETLRENVVKAHSYIKKHITTEFWIIIADNGSTDQTASIGAELESEYSEIKFLKVSKRGVGLALRTSWMASNADYVGYMDLDLATDLKHLKDVIGLFHDEADYDVINGSRLLKGAQVVNRKPIRNVTSHGFNFIVQKLLGVQLSDGMCGFKFFKRSVAQKLIKSGIDRDGWFFSTEILVRALWAGYKVKEIPVEWTDDVNSKVNIKKLTLEYLKAIMQLRKQKRTFKKSFKRA